MPRPESGPYSEERALLAGVRLRRWTLRDNLDHRLHDIVALDEIDLYADVLTAVAAADRRLTDEEIDAVLGVRAVGAAGSGGRGQPA